MSSTHGPPASHITRSKRPAEIAIRRLDGIGDVLSGLNLSELHTQEEMTRALWTLDTADKCIRAILAEFRTEAPTEQMVRTSEKLFRLIELARDEVYSSSKALS